ncbi:MAG: hypothetical protein ACNI27_07080 [Desulfovibrio sp.]
MANRREHPPETVFKAQELYCVERKTFDQVAALVKVAASTLKRWAKKYEWQEKRNRLAEAESDIRFDLTIARSEMIKKLMAKGDPQAAFAVSCLETLAMKQAEAARLGHWVDVAADAASQNELVISNQEEAAEALQKAVETKLARLLTNPDAIDFKTVKDLRESLLLIQEMKPKKEAGVKSKRGISKAVADAIREAS